MAVSADERRRQIVEAAVRVFARNGYHGCRVADIADEAGVAYGLVYHYFSSKRQLLEEIFAETWAEVVAAIERAREREASGSGRLSYLTHFLLSSYVRAPDLVRVLIREVARSPELDRQTAELQRFFQLVAGVIAEAQQAGEFRDDIDPQLAATALYGALEQLVTRLVLGELHGDPAAVEQAEAAFNSLLVDGLRARP